MEDTKSKMQPRMKMGLFVNYLIHGFALIILTQNLNSLATSWNSSLAVASYVLSGIGIGRIVAYLLMGFISDHFSRKLTLLIGMVSYFLFFTITPFNHLVSVAYGLSILAGVANSALDSATYPIFTEFNSKSGANNILLKAFISIGEFILPLVVMYLNSNQIWFGFSFILPSIILILNLINIGTLRFPKPKTTVKKQIANGIPIGKFKKALITAALLVYGYTSMAVMIWFTQWITIFAGQIGYGNWTSHFLMSLYSIGSIIGVLLAFTMVNRFSIQNHWLLGMNVLGTVAIALVAFSRIPILTMVAAFFFGLSSAGGVMQIGLTILLSIFPKYKGILTSIYFLFGSLASFSVPILSGYLTRFGNQNIITADVLIGIVGVISTFIVFILMPRANTLNDARNNINQIDVKIAKLLDKRFQSVEEINAFKKKQNLATEDKDREANVLDQIDRLTKSKAMRPYNQDIFQNIMENSKKYQESLKANKK